MLSNYGYQVFGILSTVVAAVVSAWAYSRRSRTDLDARRDGQTLDAQAVPIAMLKEELLRTREELTEARALDRQERVQHAEDMTAVRKAIEEIALDIRGQREEARQHAANVHKRLDVIDKDMIRVKERLRIANDE